MDVSVKKTVLLNYAGHRLELRVAQDLFSSHEVDVGTQLLLRTLMGEEHLSRRAVLDLGCGYGPIGLGLKAQRPDRVVHMVDRDALAVEYSRENASHNGLAGVEVYGSLDYQDLRMSGFDLVVSNIPAKAGRPVIERLLLKAADVLAPDGLVAVVVISPLRTTVTEILEGSPHVDVTFHRATASYAVFHYRFRDQSPPVSAADDGANLKAYERQRVLLDRDGIRIHVRTAHNLPEFDSLNFGTEMWLMRYCG